MTSLLGIEPADAKYASTSSYGALSLCICLFLACLVCPLSACNVASSCLHYSSTGTTECSYGKGMDSSFLYHTHGSLAVFLNSFIIIYLFYLLLLLLIIKIGGRGQSCHSCRDILSLWLFDKAMFILWLHVKLHEARASHFFRIPHKTVYID